MARTHPRRRPAAPRRILECLHRMDRPLSFEAIAGKLDATGTRARRELEAQLDEMVHRGQLLINRRGQYGLAERMDLVAGRVVGHPDGHGFLVPTDGSGNLFLPPKEMRMVMHGDMAMASITGFDRRGRRQGQIVEVLKRHNEAVVGHYRARRGLGVVVPEDPRLQHDVLIAPADAGGAEDGDIVVARLLEQPQPHRAPVGEIIERLGRHMSPAIATDVALRIHGLPLDWPAPVQQAGASMPASVGAADRRDRTDLREMQLVTIDGADARDFDDAVWCEPRGAGWRLVVAIADVAHYVKPGDLIDVEARERGTSAYFPDRVVPMLPEVLSNGLCSLKPAEDRLCLVCDMRVDGNGHTRSSRFYPAVMRSAARLTYTEVAAMLEEGDARLRKRHAALLPPLEALQRVYRALRGARRRRGAIDFEGRAINFELDRAGNIAAIVPYELTQAHQLIEECMIAANVQAARFLLKHKVPALFRVHEPPEATKLEDTKAFLESMGLQLGGGKKPQPRHFAKLIDIVQGKPYQRLIQEVLLRAQSLAVYRAENLGHFGLALDAYAHFTSPIRRYPDLVVHRAIHHVLGGGKPDDYPYATDEMQSLGLHCSLTSRRAELAARDVESWYQCAYMQRHLGDEFSGTVTGVQPFGLFVEVDDLLVQGLIHVTALKSDYYHFDPIAHRLTGERTGRSFQLADRVRVQVSRVDLDERKIDFELVDVLTGWGTEPRRSKRGRPGRGKPGRGGKRRGKKPAKKKKKARRKRRRR